MRYSITSNLLNNLSKNWENMFSIRKNRILNTLINLRISHDKGPEYLYRLFYVLLQQIMCEMKTIQVQVYIQQ